MVHICIIAFSRQDYGFVITPFHIQHSVISALLYAHHKNKEFTKRKVSVHGTVP
jgi:hypothetical protein